jgi:hypothetical protein
MEQRSGMEQESESMQSDSIVKTLGLLVMFQ